MRRFWGEGWGSRRPAAQAGRERSRRHAWRLAACAPLCPLRPSPWHPLVPPPTHLLVELVRVAGIWQEVCGLPQLVDGGEQRQDVLLKHGLQRADHLQLLLGGRVGDLRTLAQAGGSPRAHSSKGALPRGGAGAACGACKLASRQAGCADMLTCCGHRKEPREVSLTVPLGRMSGEPPDQWSELRVESTRVAPVALALTRTPPVARAARRGRTTAGAAAGARLAAFIIVAGILQGGGGRVIMREWGNAATRRPKPAAMVPAITGTGSPADLQAPIPSAAACLDHPGIAIGSTTPRS